LPRGGDGLERVELGRRERARVGESHGIRRGTCRPVHAAARKTKDLDLGRVEKQEIVRCGSLITADDDDLPRLHLVFVRHRALQEARPDEPLGDLRRGT